MSTMRTVTAENRQAMLAAVVQAGISRGVVVTSCVIIYKEGD